MSKSVFKKHCIIQKCLCVTVPIFLKTQQRLYFHNILKIKTFYGLTLKERMGKSKGFNSSFSWPPLQRNDLTNKKHLFAALDFHSLGFGPSFTSQKKTEILS